MKIIIAIGPSTFTGCGSSINNVATQWRKEQDMYAEHKAEKLVHEATSFDESKIDLSPDFDDLAWEVVKDEKIIGYTPQPDAYYQFTHNLVTQFSNILQQPISRHAFRCLLGVINRYIKDKVIKAYQGAEIYEHHTIS